MKKFFKEFKEFITRGNVLDMAVGIIIGGAFTAITGALQLVLRDAVLDAEGNVVTQALIIDFGAVISAIITFLITAFVLFLIVKTVNSVRARGEKLKEEHKKKKEAKEEEVIEEAVQEAAQPAVEEVKVSMSATDELLAEIRDLLKAQSIKSDENNQ